MSRVLLKRDENPFAKRFAASFSCHDVRFGFIEGIRIAVDRIGADDAHLAVVFLDNRPNAIFSIFVRALDRSTMLKLQ